jgi:exodeoxyribonuclease V alpha subunit
MTIGAYDDLDRSLARGATGLLATFNAAGVLGLADVHTATAVGRIGDELDEHVGLAVALAVRALRMGSVCIDLRTVHSEVFDASEQAGSLSTDRSAQLNAAQVDIAGLPWPDPDDWLAACERSPLVALGQDAPSGRPIRLAHGLLYLERYWQQEEVVRGQLLARFTQAPPEIDSERLAAGLARLFTGEGLAINEPDSQRLAAAVTALSWVSVLAGGPGTGKTTTVARLLALLLDQPGPPPRIALAAPTGKAAARLAEAIRSAAAELPPGDRERIGEISASTLHRLLGWLPGSRGRFAHNATNHLPFDVVIVDEMSMVPLTMMARLLEAVGARSRLVLVGDPDQLSSVEAGAVLADIAEAAGHPNLQLGAQLSALKLLESPAKAPVHGVVRLTHTWRYGGAIDTLAKAIKAADADETISILRSGASDVLFVESALDVVQPVGLDILADEVRRQGLLTRTAASAGDVSAALSALDEHRLLCAHRSGPYGMGRWSLEAERWLAEAVPGYGEDGEWYLGRPVLVTTNDYELSLYNGDTGVVVNTPKGPRVAFARGSGFAIFPPVRLDAVQTVHAMTVHRAQGSQFDCVSFIVPPANSPLLTRELLYTAISRASLRVQVFGTEEAIRRAVLRPANRASGLRGRL